LLLEVGSFKGRKVLDMGCGDGFFTMQFWDSGQPSEMTGIDASPEAIKVANERKADRSICYEVGDAHHLPYPDNRFDLVLAQSILHHDDDPQDMIREALRLAPEVLIHEPNGNNIGLKIIEQISPYHRKHSEKSYTTHQIKGWIEQSGGKAITHKFAGFVPMFSPDWLALTMKGIEPLIEAIPLLNAARCAVQVLLARRIER
jgi:2-polyprenyl-3-methyl-5-hydroxy-6-metoxy-1,4-benzoquinol methylase